MPRSESCSVDLGAAYVHGCNETNSVWRLAQCTRQPLDTSAGGYSIGWGDGCVWRSLDGRILPRPTVKRAFEVIFSPFFFSAVGSIPRRLLECVKITKITVRAPNRLHGR